MAGSPTMRFGYAQDHFPRSELNEKSRDLISKAVRKEFPRNAEWSGEWHYITIPHIQFVTRNYPYYFDFTLDLYLAAFIDVEWKEKGYYGSFSKRCVVIEPIKKEIGNLLWACKLV